MEILKLKTTKQSTHFQSETVKSEKTRIKYSSLSKIFLNKNFHINNNLWDVFKEIFNLQMNIINLINMELAELHRDNISLADAHKPQSSSRFNFLRKCLNFHKNIEEILLKYVDEIFSNAFESTESEEINYLIYIRKIMGGIIINPENKSKNIIIIKRHLVKEDYRLEFYE